jgi:hypothetical protein
VESSDGAIIKFIYVSSVEVVNKSNILKRDNTFPQLLQMNSEIVH